MLSHSKNPTERSRKCHARNSNRLFAFFVIAAAEVLLQPHVEADEEVAAAHLFEGEFGNAGAAIPPGYRHDSPTISPHNRFEWQFDRQIEMGRQQRAATLDHGGAVGLEGVGSVVEIDTEH